MSEILDINCGNDNPKHYRPLPKETSFCAKRWSSPATFQREMESVCAVCGQRAKEEERVV